MKHEMDLMRRQLEEGLVKIKQLQDINSNYTSEIKVQKRIQHKLKKEVEVADSTVKMLQKDLIEERQKSELVNLLIIKISNQRKEMDTSLNSQKSETLVAEQAISKMHKGSFQI